MKFALTKEEKQVLLRKYIRGGLTFEQAKDKLGDIVFHLKEVVKGLRKEKKTPVEIKKKFMEEFEKICMED